MNKTVYFLIDCSGSMYPNRGDAVNTAMEKIVTEAVPDIKTQKNDDLNISFVFLGFSDNFTGKVVELMPRTELDDFDHWDTIESSMFNGGTPTGAGIKAIIDDLNGGRRGEPDPNAVAPVIILISDGEPNGDNPSYDEVLEYAVKGGPKEDKMFRKAIRVALGMDVSEAGRTSLKKFGSVSAKMASAGIESYYDCSEDYVDDFVSILKSVTVNASIG